MIDPFFGSVLGAATNIVGGIMGNESRRKANELAAENAAHQLNAQMEFATKGLTWRARDAMAAYKETGLHPLAMLGVQGPTYSPTTTAFNAGSPLGEGIARAGQDISRGIHASADRELRGAAMNMQMERYSLENELIRTRIASERARVMQGTNPPMQSPGGDNLLIPGQGDSPPNPGGFIKYKPNEVTPQMTPGLEPGRQPDVGHVEAPGGGKVLVPGKEFHDRAEDMPGTGWQWWWRNNIGLAFDKQGREAVLGKPAPGYEWKLNVMTGEWFQVQTPNEGFVRPRGGRSVPWYNSGRSNWP